VGIGGKILKKMTGAQLFAAPRNARKAKTRLERAMLTIVAARERAVEISEQRTAQVLKVRPTAWQKRRLARLSGKC
jgi:hypothetical protein